MLRFYFTVFCFATFVSEALAVTLQNQGYPSISLENDQNTLVTKKKENGAFSQIQQLIKIYKERFQGFLTNEPCFEERWVPMKDGVKLHTTIIIPYPCNVTVPTAYSRSPYGPTSDNIADFFLLQGKAVVMQNMRGSALSEGKFDIWQMAGSDGYDTMEWIAQQEWSNGDIYDAGISADGIAAYFVNLYTPKWLKGQLFIWAASDGHKTMFDQGAFREGLAEDWLLFVSGFTRLESIKDIDIIKDHEVLDPWWNNVTLEKKWENVKSPTVTLSGWFDIFNEASLHAFEHMRSGSDEKVRDRHYLIVGPNGHCDLKHPLTYPDSLSVLPLFVSEKLFSDKEHEIVAAGIEKITFYVMGPLGCSAASSKGDVDLNNPCLGNYWVTLPKWPVSTSLNFYFGASNKLTITAPQKTWFSASSWSYFYSSMIPIHTYWIGGCNLFESCGSENINFLKYREDVHLFNTAPLTSPVAITGKILVDLYVSSNAVDTDFVVFLVDQYDGKSFLVRTGNVRMKWRDGMTKKAEDMIPKKVYKVQIELWPTSYIFNANHQIGIFISSSNYPHISANPNNGLLLKDEKSGTSKIAHNTIYFSKEYPSKVILPVVGLNDIPRAEQIYKFCN